MDLSRLDTDAVVESQHSMMLVVVIEFSIAADKNIFVSQHCVFTLLLSLVYFPQVYQINVKSGPVEVTGSILMPNIDNHHSVSSTKKEQNKDFAEG